MVFIKKVTRFKNLISQTKGNKNLKEKALDNAGDEEKNNLNAKDKKKFEYTKLRLADDYQYVSKKEKQTEKKLIKKNYLKNQQ